MLRSISWSQLAIFLTILNIAYYTLIAITYYRLHSFLISVFGIGNYKNQKAPCDDPPTDPDNLFEIASSLVNKIKINIGEGSSGYWVREEFILSFQILLREYPALKGTAFQAEINHFIEKTCKKDCLIALSDDELSGLWNG